MTSSAWALRPGTRSVPQTGRERNYIGGMPSVDPETAWPSCLSCASSMTFFLQVTPPEDHAWAGRTIAVFSCTQCYDHTPDEFRSPGAGRTWEEVEKQGTDVDDRFIDGAAAHIRMIAGPVDQAAIRAEPPPHVEFRPLVSAAVAQRHDGLKVGGIPTLDPILSAYMADARYRGERVVFLFQVPAKRKFPRLPSAPMRRDYTWPPDQPDAADPDQRFYELGGGGVVFAFGAAVGDPAGYLVSRNPIGGR